MSKPNSSSQISIIRNGATSCRSYCYQWCPCCPAKLQDNADTLNLQDLSCFAVWQESINETYTTSSADDTYKVTDRMLATLGGALALHMHRMTTHLPPSAYVFVTTSCVPELYVKALKAQQHVVCQTCNTAGMPSAPRQYAACGLVDCPHYAAQCQCS